MRIFICTDHAVFNPVDSPAVVGPRRGASVVLAESEAEAGKLLDTMLRLRGLPDSGSHPYSFTEVAADKAQAVILRDGEY